MYFMHFLQVHLCMFKSETAQETCFLYAPHKFTGLETSQPWLWRSTLSYFYFSLYKNQVKRKEREREKEEGRKGGREGGRKKERKEERNTVT